MTSETGGNLEILIASAAVAVVILLAMGVLGRKPTEPRDAHLPRKARQAIAQRRTLKTLPSQFIVADIETTGLNPNTDKIIEIAAVRVNRDSDLHQTFTVLVRPRRKLPEKIVQMTGISDEMLDQDGCEIADAMSQFLDFVGDDMMVFYNAPFDIAFLELAAGRIGRKIPNKVCCALRVARAAWPAQPSYKLAEVAKLGNLETDGAHRALADCKMTVSVYAAAVVESGRVGYIRGRRK